MILDTYEVVLDDVHFEALGTNEDEARKYLQSWLHEFTEGYKLRRFYLKKRFDQKDCRVVKGLESNPLDHRRADAQRTEMHQVDRPEVALTGVRIR